MLARESLDPSRSIWHFTAFHLRRYRKAHGMSGQALGDLLDCDRSTVSRYESNTLKLKPEHAEIIDRVWNTGGMFTALVGFAERADEGNWLVELAEMEARASRIRMWESSVIPGLFQTPDYARAALSAGTAEDLEATLDDSIYAYLDPLAFQEAVSQPAGAIRPHQLPSLVRNRISVVDRGHYRRRPLPIAVAREVADCHVRIGRAGHADRQRCR